MFRTDELIKKKKRKTFLNNYYSPYLKNRDPAISTVNADYRLAKKGDEDTLANIHIERQGGDKKEIREAFQREIKSNGKNNTLIVAHLRKDIFGLARYRVLKPNENLGYRNMPAGVYLLGNIVKNIYRRRGIGRGLVEERLNMIRSQFQCAYTFVDKENLSMIALLAEIGFEELTDDFTYPRIDSSTPRLLLVKNF